LFMNETTIAEIRLEMYGLSLQVLDLI